MSVYAKMYTKIWWSSTSTQVAPSSKADGHELAKLLLNSGRNMYPGTGYF